MEELARILPEDTRKRYWLLREVSAVREAGVLFKWYVFNKCPVLLFVSSWSSTFIVAGYASDEDHDKARTETGVNVLESYAGLERVKECLKYHSLLAVANVGMVAY